MRIRDFQDKQESIKECILIFIDLDIYFKSMKKQNNYRHVI